MADRIVARLPELDDGALLVELMRLVALLGERDGHSGIGPLATDHDRPMHIYPINAHEFSDGVFVVAAIRRPELVGARLLAVQGRPVEDVLASVEPLVTRDNAMTVKARRPVRPASHGPPAAGEARRRRPAPERRQRTTSAIFVGEAMGGSPNHYSDASTISLPVTGWTVGIPRFRFEKLPGESGLTFEPNVHVDLTAVNFFAGRDPVLAAALAVRR